MEKIKVFYQEYPSSLESDINKFIRENQIIVRDVKYQVTPLPGENVLAFTALMIYEEA